MGIYLNPGNSGFAGIRNDQYVDKTGLIELINDAIDTPRRLACISRPRRFGKSFAAQMLCAYYDYSCDSHELFTDLEIARKEDYERHLNKYHVVNLDITSFLSVAKRKRRSLADVPDMIVDAIYEELIRIYPCMQSFPRLCSTVWNRRAESLFLLLMNGTHLSEKRNRIRRLRRHI